WLGLKLIHMIEQATGTTPLLYHGGDTRIMLIVPTGVLPDNIPTDFHGWKLVRLADSPVAPATDDWPYLYLQKRGIPLDYAMVIGILATVSLICVTLLRGSRFGGSDAHFLFMGWGFLLLQTKSIGDCSLYFGTTWLVTTLVITGALLMVLLSNWVAIRFVSAF